jgi:hypothetical protein
MISDRQASRFKVHVSGELKTHLNFLFFARHSFAILSTFALQSSIAFSNSFVTRSEGSSFTKDTVVSCGGAVAVVSTVVTDTMVLAIGMSLYE